METSENPDKPKPSTEPEAFVDAVEAGKFLRLRPRRVLELARQGAIPAYPLGSGERRVWRFRLSELASALCSRGVDCANAAVRAKEKN
jgi:helix-turn-helix protein